MFEIEAISVDEIKTLVNTASVILQEITFEVDDEGLKFRSMDSSHSALVDAILKKDYFSKFDCPKPTRFALYSETLKKIMKIMDTGKEVRIKFDGDDINFKSAGKDFTFHVIEPLLPAPLPKLTYNSEFKISLNTWKKILDDISTLSHTIKIQSLVNSLVFDGQGESGEGHIELKKAVDEALLKLDVKEESHARYNLDMLIPISKQASSDLLARYSTQMPIEISWKLLLDKQSISSEIGEVKFYLAPIVDQK